MTPPRFAPPPRVEGVYRAPWTERVGLEDPAVIRAFAWTVPIAVVTTAVVLWSLWSLGWWVAVTGALLSFPLTMLVGIGGSVGLAHLAGVAAGRILLPTGRSTPAVEDFSLEKSLVVRGMVQGAVRHLETRLRAEPGNLALRLFLADLYAGEARQPLSAERLYLGVKRDEAATAGQHLHATNRLIDLYGGALRDPAAAAREMRDLAERHPGSRGAALAAEALRDASTADA